MTRCIISILVSLFVPIFSGSLIPEEMVLIQANTPSVEIQYFTQMHPLSMSHFLSFIVLLKVKFCEPDPALDKSWHSVIICGVQ